MICFGQQSVVILVRHNPFNMYWNSPWGGHIKWPWVAAVAVPMISLISCKFNNGWRHKLLWHKAASHPASINNNNSKLTAFERVKYAKVKCVVRLPAPAPWCCSHEIAVVCSRLLVVGSLSVVWLPDAWLWRSAIMLQISNWAACCCSVRSANQVGVPSLSLSLSLCLHVGAAATTICIHV